jgi:hypothetical protein
MRGDAPLFHVPPLLGYTVVEQPLHLGEISGDHAEPIYALAVDSEFLKRIDHAPPCSSREEEVLVPAVVVAPGDETAGLRVERIWEAIRTTGASHVEGLLDPLHALQERGVPLRVEDNELIGDDPGP